MDLNVLLSSKPPRLGSWNSDRPMPLTQTAEYALRAAVWLAQHPSEPQTKTQIAAGTQVPASYLPKVVQPLVRGQLVRAQRGIGGGYALARSASEITLLDVVEEVDPIRTIDSCPLNFACHGKQLCPLHSLLNRSIVAERRQLAEACLTDVLGLPGQLTSLCESGGLRLGASGPSCTSVSATGS